MKIYNENNKLINHKNVEHIEQELTKKYIQPNDIVLELGARYGSVSITTNKILNDNAKKSHYVVEPDSSVWNALERNMKENNCHFNIIKGTISEKKYSLTNNRDSYAKRSIEDNNSSIERFNLPDIKFNVLIADCEGFLETFYDENIELFKSLDKLILEFDEPKTCDYTRLKKEFFELGFVVKEEINHHGLFHYVFIKPKLQEKVLICSLSNRPILSQPMFEKLKSYCLRHNYKCVLENELLTDTRSPSWSKILLLQREMKNNPDIDLIVWIDDDILITRIDLRFEDLLRPYKFVNSKENILVSEDVVWSPFNCGVLVCKNNSDTYDYLQHIWDLCEKYPEKKFGGLWEQDIMVKDCQLTSVMNPNEPLPLKIIPHNVIQSFYRDHDLPENKKWKIGHFSAHFTGMSLEKRIELRDEVLKYFEK